MIGSRFTIVSARFDENRIFPSRTYLVIGCDGSIRERLELFEPWP
jgi:hypothetical protein